jgi:tetratricopeptide (TPR) repeat protein
VLEHTLSEDEHNQIVQTIEMFEAITQTQPDDYQSLEILKEAYAKIGKKEDSLRISRRLAEAYFNVGSFTNSLQECETILLKEPNAPDILAMLGEIETRLQASGQAIANSSAGKDQPNGDRSGLINKSFGNDEQSGLVDMGHRHGKNSKQLNLNDRGEEQLAKFMIVQQLFGEEKVGKALGEVLHLNKDLSGQALAVSLIEELCRDNMEKLEKVLSALIDRTKFAYVPLEYYDLDRQIAPMLPENLTLGRLMVPFDLVSRTMMVACCNPFDVEGREAVQQSVDYTVMWYLARPSALIRSLQSIYRLESRA